MDKHDLIQLKNTLSDCLVIIPMSTIFHRPVNSMLSLYSPTPHFLTPIGPLNFSTDPEPSMLQVKNNLFQKYILSTNM